MKYTNIVSNTISLAAISMFFIFTPTNGSMRRSEAPVTKQDHAMSKLTAKTGVKNVTLQDIKDFNEEMNPELIVITDKKSKSKSSSKKSKSSGKKSKSSSNKDKKKSSKK